MDALEIQTSAGRFALIGNLHRDRRRQALLVVTGTFPAKEDLHDLVRHFGGAHVLLAYLPGMRGTQWQGASVEDLGRGLDELVELLLRDQPLVVLGVSTGNLAALAMAHPNVQRRVAVEPFFTTKDLWPLVKWARDLMVQFPKDASTAAYFRDLFGIGPDTVENRDYRRLLARITQPTDVIHGSLPLLPERPLGGWPSLVGVEDLAALAANPLVTLHEGRESTGHGVTGAGPGKELLKELVHKALLALT